MTCEKRMETMLNPFILQPLEAPSTVVTSLLTPLLISMSHLPQPLLGWEMTLPGWQIWYRCSWQCRNDPAREQIQIELKRDHLENHRQERKREAESRSSNAEERRQERQQEEDCHWEELREERARDEDWCRADEEHWPSWPPTEKLWRWSDWTKHDDTLNINRKEQMGMPLDWLR